MFSTLSLSAASSSSSSSSVLDFASLRVNIMHACAHINKVGGGGGGRGGDDRAGESRAAARLSRLWCVAPTGTDEKAEKESK